MKIYEREIEIRRELSYVWNYIINPEDWTKWLLKKKIRMNGPMAEGMTGVLIGNHSKGKQEFVFTVENIREMESFSLSMKVAWLRVVFTYSVKENERGTELRHKVELTGFLSFLIAQLFKKSVKNYVKSVLLDAQKILESNS